MNQQVQDCADILFSKMQVEWAAGWAVKDFCLALVEGNHEGFIRAVAREHNLSHRTIMDGARLAKLVPTERRVPFEAPVTHWKYVPEDQRPSKFWRKETP